MSDDAERKSSPGSFETERETEDKRHKNDRNSQFYRNTEATIPKLECAEEKWTADQFYSELMNRSNEKRYVFMEIRHDYIQWLFPTFGQSMFNSSSFSLSPYEVIEMRKDAAVAVRFVRFYKMFLDFLGGELVDLEKGEIRVNTNKKMRLERFDNFNTNEHNFFRVTRIINSLRAFGFERYIPQFMKFFEDNMASFKHCLTSFHKFWKKAAQNDRSVSKEPENFDYSDSIFFDELKRGGKEYKGARAVVETLNEFEKKFFD
ncbi:hypothetical protein EIN_489980 [Entamoeba invadens IP1]|uniref:Opioid growth factor receptor (OGFr) conserved domain-containing protein n=1 Tax=Entamoeba invadens IP1 TaxID=370355 RepID=A0A0A1U9X4_ENTIV|nr:hypothetical protein EIN_489980 [Entamoeba invadens IP1]ELP88939.1 hypothetical protein EIN_489980 [Entamoeba invadens IP1]|eukprot:XP_004255710.1 hypothetical protein EIN_489980 [Entamoeba invadens IP1]